MSPYSGANDPKLPKHIASLSRATRAKWTAVWNDEYQQCLDDGGDRCEGSAFRIANGAIKEMAEFTVDGMYEAATLKTRAQALMRDMESLLSLRGVPQKLRDEINDVRRELKRTWADLAATEEDSMELGDIAIVADDGRTLAEVVAEKDTPEAVAENGAYETYEDLPIILGAARSFEDLRAAREAQDMAAMAEQLFYDFSNLVRGVWYDTEAPDKGTAILTLAQELASELGNLQNLAAETDAEHSDTGGEQPDVIGGDTASESDEGIAPAGSGDKNEEDDMASSTVEEGREDTLPRDSAGKQEDVIETQTDGTERLCESSDGAEVLSLGTLAETEASGPLTVKVKLIQPGPGNKADGHFYPASMLARDAGRFVGAKMYETDHVAEEKSTRTWVSTIRAVSEFTDSGAPLAEVVVHDPSFADRLRNLSQAEMLDKMECSILASGKVKEGEVEGETYRIVEAIESVQSVDWVTKAGAGGQAIALAEADTEETEQPGGEPVAEDKSPAPNAGEPTEETKMDAEQVKAWLDEKANLPAPVIELLSEREYEDVTALEAAVTDMGKALAEHLGSGRVKDMNAPEPEPEPTPESVREAYEAGLDAVNKKWLGR